MEGLPVPGKLSLCDHRLFKLTVKREVLMSWIQNEKSDNKNLKQNFSLLKAQTTKKPQFPSSQYDQVADEQYYKSSETEHTRFFKNLVTKTINLQVLKGTCCLVCSLNSFGNSLSLNWKKVAHIDNSVENTVRQEIKEWDQGQIRQSNLNAVNKESVDFTKNKTKQNGNEQSPISSNCLLSFFFFPWQFGIWLCPISYHHNKPWVCFHHQMELTRVGSMGVMNAIL